MTYKSLLINKVSDPMKQVSKPERKNERGKKMMYDGLLINKISNPIKQIFV